MLEGQDTVSPRANPALPPTLIQLLHEADTAYRKAARDTNEEVTSFWDFAERWLAQHPIVSTFYAASTMGFVLGDGTRCTWSAIDQEALMASDKTDTSGAVQATTGQGGL